jgi:hypothetical protein
MPTPIEVAAPQALGARTRQEHLPEAPLGGPLEPSPWGGNGINTQARGGGCSRDPAWGRGRWGPGTATRGHPYPDSSELRAVPGMATTGPA